MQPISIVLRPYKDVTPELMQECVQNQISLYSPTGQYYILLPKYPTDTTLMEISNRLRGVAALQAYLGSYDKESPIPDIAHDDLIMMADGLNVYLYRCYYRYMCHIFTKDVNDSTLADIRDAIKSICVNSVGCETAYTLPYQGYSVIMQYMTELPALRDFYGLYQHFSHYIASMVMKAGNYLPAISQAASGVVGEDKKGVYDTSEVLCYFS